jgi:hypothetical protein
MYMKTSITDLIANGTDYITLFAFVCFGLAALIILVHEIRIVFTANEKKRYDYVNQHEIQYFRYAIIAFIAGASVFLTVKISPHISIDSNLKPVVDIFFLLGFVVVSYYVLSSLVRTLYPRFLENRLMRIRNKPRTSTAGNTMRKLSADEGAVHLEGDEFTNTSNVIHTIQYDVWVDDKTGEKRIEKYFVHQHANQCEECGYYTMMIDNEEIVKHPNLQEPGVLIEHYQCTYCSHREAKQVAIAPISTNLAGAI